MYIVNHKLLDSVHSKCGEDIAKKFSETLNSFSWKRNMVMYHAYEVKQIIENAVSTSLDTDQYQQTIAYARAAILATSPSEKGDHIFKAQFKTEAHIIASAQALHSLVDIASHIIYYALLFDELDIFKLDIYKIRDKLNQIKRYTNTHELIIKLIESEEFKYLNAYVNTTKHISLVSSNISASFVPEVRGGIKINSFSYVKSKCCKQCFDSKWAEDFLFKDNCELLSKIVAVVNSLNTYFE